MNEERRSAQDEVPLALRVAAAWSWRILVVALAVLALVALVARLKVLTLSVFVGLLLTALLAPLHARLLRWGVPRGLATAATLVGLLLVLFGLAGLIGGSVVSEWGSLELAFREGIAEIRSWLSDGPIGASDSQIDTWLANLQQWLSDRQSSLVSGALSTAVTAVEVISGALLALFSAIFFLHDGAGIGRWATGLFPRSAQPGVHAAGVAAWRTLTGYVRGTMTIALVDAISIGIVLAILRVPLALPLAVLVFFGAFVPIVGALVTGFVAVVVAFAANGVWSAVIVLGAIIAVQQVEGHLLQPLVMGRLVRLHPLAVVLAVTAGSLLAGIVGAVVAVPLVAVVNVVVRTYRARSVAAAEPAPRAAEETVVRAVPSAQSEGHGDLDADVDADVDAAESPRPD